MAKHSPRRRAFDRILGHRLEAVAAYLIYAVLGLLPLDAASAVGAWAGRIVGPRLRTHAKVLRRLQRAMPELPEERRRTIARQSWENLGRTLAEYPHIKTIARDWDRRVEMVGAEHLRALRDDGRPGICVTAHLANWELAGLACQKLGLPLTIVYRAPNNRWVDRLLARARRPLHALLVPKGRDAARGMVAALRGGGHIGVLPDQKLNEGIPVPFFGRDAMTGTFTADLALRYGAPIVPIRVTRLAADKGGDRRFRVEAMAPLALKSSGDRAADTRAGMEAVNAVLEGWVRAHPGQWMWSHNRWPD
ncbi:lysophospholipid acyltransferase family protein [Nitrospirillum viridazoti]|uniref:Lauroyl acyltransferase n=1 Tax=Nitrospirillum viridazoti CBAmc TaxID=1441467 RepID=A0A248JS51_9PROT|nr:lauroyl acyltransferase [Nitrospirillum amazonense]ASG21340.1 lauroyl acyltransferase [Nitrospirillum amazonense CBAmc]TWB33009.1 KDO2-lipid IV(A) lauroyltransferase [Nitrospirillum amazonense]